MCKDHESHNDYRRYNPSHLNLQKKNSSVLRENLSRTNRQFRSQTSGSSRVLKQTQFDVPTT